MCVCVSAYMCAPAESSKQITLCASAIGPKTTTQVATKSFLACVADVLRTSKGVERGNLRIQSLSLPKVRSCMSDVCDQRRVNLEKYIFLDRLLGD